MRSVGALFHVAEVDGEVDGDGDAAFHHEHTWQNVSEQQVHGLVDLSGAGVGYQNPAVLVPCGGVAVVEHHHHRHAGGEAAERDEKHSQGDVFEDGGLDLRVAVVGGVHQLGAVVEREEAGVPHDGELQAEDQQ